MLRKLLSLYKDSILFSTPPKHPTDQLYIFFDSSEEEWVGIPKKRLSEKELDLLKTLYELIEFQTPAFTLEAKSWYEFLLTNGPLPSHQSETFFRFIQFHIKDAGVDQLEIETALKGFFTENVIIVWVDANQGVVIEEKKQISLSETELILMSETLENDFYVKIFFYIGKPYPFSENLRLSFQKEKEYFSFGQKYIVDAKVFSLERIFPTYLAYHLPDELTQMLNQVISEVFHDDPEMFSTIKVFLENNLNASVTAKKLYIHRNTLQYRIDKFVEKTGIGLKDFYGAFTVFIASLQFELDKK